MGIPTDRSKVIRSLFFGGILPVIAFTLVEEYFGTLWGLIAGMVFGVGEIFFEKFTRGRVDAITWGGNGMLFVLGGVSLFTKEGLWFKLQPAILETVMGLVLVGSVLIGRPVLLILARKQNVMANIPAPIQNLMNQSFSGLTLRVGIFFLLHAGLATWAALSWSTRAWALLKGVGFTVSLILYMLAEMLILRRRISKRAHTLSIQAGEPPAKRDWPQK